MGSDNSNSGSVCPICVGRGVVDWTKFRQNVTPGRPWSPEDPHSGTQATARQDALQVEKIRIWDKAHPPEEVHARTICPACFGLGTDETCSSLLDDAILLWFLIQEECPSRPLESFRCQACTLDYPLTEKFFQHIPLSKPQQRQRDGELNNRLYYSTIAYYWMTNDLKERERLLHGSKMEVIFYCSNTACRASYSEYPTYIPPKFPYADEETIRKNPYKPGYFESGFKHRDALPGNLCQSCGVGEVLVWFGFVNEQKWAARTMAGVNTCTCGSALEHVKESEVPKFDRFRDCGDALVDTRNLQLTPLATAAGVGKNFWTNAGAIFGNRKITRKKVQHDLENFLERICEAHFVYAEVASAHERAAFEKYQAELKVFRANLVNPALASTVKWRETYLSDFRL